MGVEFQMKEYEQGEGPEFSKQEWFKVKFDLGYDFPNLPYFNDDKIKITETCSIHKYLADEYMPELLGKDRSSVNMLSGAFNELKQGLMVPCYNTGIYADAAKHIDEKIQPFVTFMGDKKFLTDNVPTWFDFHFFNLLEYMDHIDPSLLTRYKTLGEYVKNMVELPGLKEYFEGANGTFCLDRHRSLKNKRAKINDVANQTHPKTYKLNNGHTIPSIGLGTSSL